MVLKGHEKPHHKYEMFEMFISDKISVSWLQESLSREQATQKKQDKRAGQDITKEEN